MNISVICHSENMHQLISKVLSFAPSRIQSFFTTDAALKMMTSNMPDLVIVFSHPEDDNFVKTTTRLREELKYTPLLICSRSREELKQFNDPMQLTQLLDYPVSVHQLIKYVTAALNYEPHTKPAINPDTYSNSMMPFLMA